MPCVKRKLLALAIVAFTIFLPKVSFAASTSCECFCGSEGAGAIDADSMTQDACVQTCSDTKTQYVGCFTDPAEYPVESDKCWTQTECSQWSDNRGGANITADWGATQPYDCSKTKTAGDPMHYCYAKDTPYNLNVTIGSTTEVGNLPTYINALYVWLLPAASLVAVVMMMIGGLQYVMARGKSKYIDAAKTRITNAITGLVLLLSAFVLLNLVDPRFTRFQSLQVPLIKQVVLLDPTSSCERLADYGYTIGPATTSTLDSSAACGGKGKITDDSGLKDNALGSWKVGDSCDYMFCADNKSCISDDGTAACRSCYDIPVGTASASSCASAEAFDTGSSGETQIYCEYNEALRSCTTAGTGLGTTASSAQGFYCGALQTHAAEKTNGNAEEPIFKGCDVYNDLDFGYLSSTLGVPDSIETDITDPEGAALLEKICTEDKCHIGSDVLTPAYGGTVRCAYDKTFGCGPSIQ